MVTITIDVTTAYTNDGGITTPVRHIEGTCLSTDEKPTNWGDGSVLTETDTATLYHWDAENQQWRPW